LSSVETIYFIMVTGFRTFSSLCNDLLEINLS